MKVHIQRAAAKTSKAALQFPQHAPSATPNSRAGPPLRSNRLRRTAWAPTVSKSPMTFLPDVEPDKKIKNDESLYKITYDITGLSQKHLTSLFQVVHNKSEFTVSGEHYMTNNNTYNKYAHGMIIHNNNLDRMCGLVRESA